MRNFGLASIFTVFVLVLSGCVITVGGGGDSPQGRHPRRGSDAATLAEIDAASDLTFNDEKEKTFIGIASRPYLSGEAQGYLVQKAMQSLVFDDSKRDVLLALVNNPTFVAEGKQAVLENLDALTFESSKTKVLEAINRRGHVPTEGELHRQLEQHPHPMQEPQEGAIQMETTVELRATYATGL